MVFDADFDDPETLKALANLVAPSVAVCKILWMSIRTFSTSMFATKSDGKDLEVGVLEPAASSVLSPEVILDLDCSHLSSFLYFRAMKMASNQSLNGNKIGFVESTSLLKSEIDWLTTSTTMNNFDDQECYRNKWKGNKYENFGKNLEENQDF